MPPPAAEAEEVGEVGPQPLGAWDPTLRPHGIPPSQGSCLRMALAATENRLVEQTNESMNALSDLLHGADWSRAVLDLVALQSRVSTARTAEGERDLT